MATAERTFESNLRAIQPADHELLNSLICCLYCDEDSRAIALPKLQEIKAAWEQIEAGIPRGD